MSNKITPIDPSKKIIVRTSQFSRELVERIHREIEAKKAEKKSG